MRVAVVGAGVAGLTCAYRLGQAGHVCDVYERWPGLGGQAATIDLGDGSLLERYYHHLFTTDRHIAELYDELGHPDELLDLPSSTAFFVDGRSWPFTSPLDLLRFRPLPLRSRIRMGLSLLRVQRGTDDPEPFEEITCREWITRHMGADAWRTVWGPLLRAKFGDRADDVAMVWLWKKFKIRREVSGKQARTEVLRWPRHSWELLFRRLAEEIERAGGRVLIDRPVATLARDGGDGFLVTPGAPESFRRGLDPREFEIAGPPERYDAVVATVPNDVFVRMLDPALRDELPTGYLGALGSIDYHAALCLVLALDRQMTPYYWMNVADELPFIGLIEQTNFVGPEHYGGRHILYVANYVDPADPLLDLDADALLAHYLPALRQVRPDFDTAWIRDRWLFREPHGQPIVDVGYRRRLAPMRTGIPGLLLGNTTHVYPEDRGTNYAVRLGNDVARELLDDVPGAAKTANRRERIASA
jgi:protoporphyrinogen oxidase